MASSLGLGHLLNPFVSKKDGDKEWEKQVWQDILGLHYGRISPTDLAAKYENAFAMSKLAISKPHILKRFERLNAGKPYDQQIKPFNFCIVGIGNFLDDEQTGKVIKPLSPYRRNAQQSSFDSFVDYESGKELKGMQYWKPFSDVLWQYINHPEAKFDGDIGVLSRKHVTVNSVTHIGKESNILEEAEILGVGDDAYTVYGSEIEQIQQHKDMIMVAEPKNTQAIGISRQTLFDVKQAIREGRTEKLKRKTIQRLLAYLCVSQ
jgi:hypothetical protein